MDKGNPGFQFVILKWPMKILLLVHFTEEKLILETDSDGKGNITQQIPKFTPK
jgi:hypothetical protein